MTTKPLLSGFDGLMSLSREGVDIRPTLLRVLTDLYVQAGSHSDDEERQFVELASRLIDQIDDATLSAVKARLASYPATPAPIMQKLGLAPTDEGCRVPFARNTSASPSVQAPVEAESRTAPPILMQPKDAAEIHDMFFRATASQRALILHNLAQAPLKAALRIPSARAKRAIETLETAAYASDVEKFTLELGESLILPAGIAAQIVDDAGGEALAVAARALDMPGHIFQRILLFLKKEISRSVTTVYRLARLYDGLSEQSALVMLAAWRGSMLAAPRPKYQPSLYDGERQRARAISGQRPAVQPGSMPSGRTGTDGPDR
jgi:hypothetical protein